MRNRWEGQNDDIDAPVTMTERELKSLRAKSMWGIVAMVLVLLVIGAAAYAMVAGPESITDIREKLGLEATSVATAEPAPADLNPHPAASTGPADSLGMPPPARPDSAPDTAKGP